MELKLPIELQRMMLEMQVAQIERSRASVEADPVRHKLTGHYPEGTKISWLHFGSIRSRGKRYRYCYATKRNLAGYFLTWREVVDLKRGGGKRDQFVASKRRKTVEAKARSRTEAHRKRLNRRACRA